MNDIQKWQCEQLAMFGGYSGKYIASWVFDKPINKVTDAEVKAIRSYLCKWGIKLTDWRNGVTQESDNYAFLVTKKKRRKQKSA